MLFQAYRTSRTSISNESYSLSIVYYYTSYNQLLSLCQDAADAGNSEIQLNIKDGSLSIDPETCLAVNRAYQEMLTDSLRRVEFALAQNRARQVICILFLILDCPSVLFTRN